MAVFNQNLDYRHFWLQLQNIILKYTHTHRQGVLMFGLVTETKINAKELICRGEGWRLHQALPIPDVGVRSKFDKKFKKQTSRLFSLAQLHPRKQETCSDIKIVMNANSPIVLINDFRNFSSKCNASLTQENYTAKDGSIHPSMVMAVHAETDIEPGVHVLVDYGEAYTAEDPEFSSGDDMDDTDAAKVRSLERRVLGTIEGKIDSVSLNEAAGTPNKSQAASPLLSRKKKRTKIIELFDDEPDDNRTQEPGEVEEVSDNSQDDVVVLGPDDDGSNNDDEDESDQKGASEDSPEDEQSEADEELNKQTSKKRKQQSKSTPEPRRRTQRLPKKKKEADPPGTPKVCNAYMMYCNQQRQLLSGFTPTDLMKEMGKGWQQLEKEEKEPYEKKSRDAKKNREKYLEDYKTVQTTCNALSRTNTHADI